jgi:hypothetical protein
MALTPRISTVTAIAMLQALADEMNAGSLGAVIEIWNGTIPVNLETAPTGTKLAVLTCSATFESTILDGTDKATLTAAAITSDTSADGTGAAQYFVAGSSSVSDTIATRVIQGSVGTTASFDLNLDDDNIVTGGTVAITGWTIDMPEA